MTLALLFNYLFFGKKTVDHFIEFVPRKFFSHKIANNTKLIQFVLFQ